MKALSTKVLILKIPENGLDFRPLTSKSKLKPILEWIRKIPVNTWRNDNVVIASKRRHFDVITSKWRRFGVTTTSLLRNVFVGMSHDEPQIPTILVSTLYDENWPSYYNFNMWLLFWRGDVMDDVRGARHITCTNRHLRVYTCKILFIWHPSFMVKSSGKDRDTQTHKQTTKYTRWKYYHLAAIHTVAMTVPRVSGMAKRYEGIPKYTALSPQWPWYATQSDK